MKKLLAILGGGAIALGISANACADPIIADGLVGAWEFNGNANDSSGNGNNGSVYGATLTSDRFGVANSAYSFDGVDDYIRVGDSPILNPTNAITISYWNKRSSLPSTWYVSFSVSKLDNTSGWLFRDDNNPAASSTGYLMTAGVVVDGTYSNRSDSPEVAASTLLNWHLESLTYDGSNAKIYIDGQMVYQDIISGLIIHSASDLFIGDNPVLHASPGNVKVFAGSIDDLFIYNRALSDSEINTLYTATTVPEPESYAMLLVGLGPLGLVARRRKQQSAWLN